MLFGSRIINCSQAETLGNLLSRSEEDKSESRVGHATFLKNFLTIHLGLLSLVPRPFVGETAWQLTRVQTVYGYDVKEITAPPVQAMNIG